MRTTDAIVIATGTVKDPELACIARGPKSLIQFDGRPAVAYLLDNLKAAQHIRRIVLVSDKATFDCVQGVDVHIDATDDSTSTVVGAIRAAQGAGRCLIMSGDMPLASSEAIDDLLVHAPDADVIYPVVSKADVKKVYPDRKAFYVNTKEGRFTGSSCLLFKPDVALANEKLMVRLLDAREDPKALLGLFGMGVALKFMFTTCALHEFEERLSDALGLAARVFISHFPGLLVSIDSVDDIKLLEHELTV